MANEQQRQRFGQALREERGGRPRAAIADLIGVTASAVTQWESGETEPSTDKVFLLEEQLRLPDGRLSSHLGYIKFPPKGDIDVVSALEQDPRIGNDVLRRMVLGVYRSAVSSSVESSPSAKPTKSSRARSS